HAIKQWKLSYLRFLKAVTLLEALELTKEEIRYFSNSFIIHGSGFLNAIPVSLSNSNTESLLEIILNLLQYKQLQKGLMAKDYDFVTLLSDPSATYTNSQDEEV